MHILYAGPEQPNKARSRNIFDLRFFIYEKGSPSALSNFEPGFDFLKIFVVFEKLPAEYTGSV
jgi:hypothetical protein